MKVSPWLRYHTAVCGCLSQALHSAQSLQPRSIYLCGGINGLSDAACKGWRQAVRDFFPLRSGRGGVRIIDPMERDYRGREDMCVDEIVEGDKRDIMAADVVLVNASRPSWGTAMEIMFAWSLHKTVISFVEAP